MIDNRAYHSDYIAPNRGQSQAVVACQNGKPAPQNGASDFVEPWEYYRISQSPPGLAGLIVDFILAQASRPNRTIAQVSMFALIAGVAGGAFQTYTGAGINIYLMLLASSGMGKEAMASGIGRLLSEVAKTVPMANQFLAPNPKSAEGLALLWQKWIFEIHKSRLS